jgi:hypothetical protein
MSIDFFGFVRDALVILYMFVLRIGVPILITLMIGAWLRRYLEERDAREAPQGSPARSGTEQHCWDVKHCPETARVECVAAQRPDLPCWLALQVSGGGLKETCYTCPVFTAENPAAVKA